MSGKKILHLLCLAKKKMRLLEILYEARKKVKLHQILCQLLIKLVQILVCYAKQKIIFLKYYVIPKKKIT